MAEHNSKHTLLSVTKLQEKLADDDLELAALDKSQGPLTKQLDTSLKEMNVKGRHITENTLLAIMFILVVR